MLGRGKSCGFGAFLLGYLEMALTVGFPVRIFFMQGRSRSPMINLAFESSSVRSTNFKISAPAWLGNLRPLYWVTIHGRYGEFRALKIPVSKLIHAIHAIQAMNESSERYCTTRWNGGEGAMPIYPRVPVP